MVHYDDRRHAGRVLASALEAYAGRPDTLVLALPRGGVPVGYEVALRLGVPLDVFVVRKLGVPGHRELAMGALASGGVQVQSQELIRRLRVPQETIASIAAAEARELARRERAYRRDRPPVDVRDKTVILVDDGLATGSSMGAAVASLRLRSPKHIVVAVPTAARSTREKLAAEADEVVCASTPEPFYAVSESYRDFSQTTDEQVRELLDAARARPG